MLSPENAMDAFATEDLEDAFEAILVFLAEFRRIIRGALQCDPRPVVVGRLDNLTVHNGPSIDVT